MSQTLELTRDLLARRSVTPADEGCQALMAQRLGAAISAVPGLRLARPVEVNAVFVDMSAAVAEAMFSMGWHFYTLSGAGYRLMCSWATTAEDVAAFARDLQRVVSES